MFKTFRLLLLAAVVSLLSLLVSFCIIGMYNMRASEDNYIIRKRVIAVHQHSWRIFFNRLFPQLVDPPPAFSLPPTVGLDDSNYWAYFSPVTMYYLVEESLALKDVCEPKDHPFLASSWRQFMIYSTWVVLSLTLLAGACAAAFIYSVLVWYRLEL